MNVSAQIPLGTPIPESQHAVSVSMPTIADVVGYEEKRSETMAKLATGYPRFVVHPFAKAIHAHWQRLFDGPDLPIWLTSSEAMAKRLQSYLSPAATKFIKHRGVSGVRLPPDNELNAQARLFLQHLGGGLPTRQAEDYLLAEGLIDHLQSEESFSGDSEAQTLATLAPILNAPPSDIVLANSGMNAFYGAFCAVNALQRPKGRHSWIKLGWLYADTMHVLDKLSGPESRNEELLDVFDLERLEGILARRGHEIAAIVTEAPTNPLIQTTDLARVHQLAKQHGIYFLVDPTVASPANLDVSSVAHIVINSLTKYAASEGDVILGAVSATAVCPEKEAFLAQLRQEVDPPYPRDLARLAAQIDKYPTVVERINRNTLAVVRFLESHPKIRKVYWPLQDKSAANFARFARSDDAVGGLIAFEYDGPFEEFHDRATVAKGPSFGINTSLLCPFIYLAHYDLVTSETGRERLRQAGIPPELLRLSIGTESPEAIIAGLADGLA